MKIYIYTILCAVFFTTSCQSVKVDTADNNFTSQTQIDPIVEESFISDSAGVYEKHFSPANYTVSIQSVKDTPIGENVHSAITIPDLALLTRGTLPNQNCIISVNGVTINSYSSTRSVAKANDIDFNSLYGNNVQFKLTANSLTKGGGSSDTTINMYVPEEITITSPKITTEEDLYPLCYYKNLSVSWNADMDNNNGLLLVIEWDGRTMYDGSCESSSVRRTEFIANDNGKVVLDPKLLDGIPDSAIINLTLLRGNIAETTVDETTYKLSGSTANLLTFVLVRDITVI